MSQKTRWGIVGTGMVAGHFAADFNHAERAELVACCSRTQSSADAFGQTWGITTAYSDYDVLLADPKIDVVYIAIPHHLHQEYCLRAFDAGKAVLCEKPFTLNAVEAKTIIDAARQHNIFCMEAMWMRCLPLIQSTKAHIQAGLIGDVIEIHAQFGYPTPFDPGNRFFDLNQSGGSLLDRGIYTIALAYHLLGAPSSVTGQARIGTTGVDESSCYQLEFANGARAELCSTLRNYASNDALIVGTKGSIRLHPPFYRPELMTLHSGQAPKRKPVSASCDQYKSGKIGQKVKRILNKVAVRFSSTSYEQSTILGYGYQFEIDEVSRCLKQGLTESPTVPLKDSLAILEIMDQLRAEWGLRYPQEA